MNNEHKDKENNEYSKVQKNRVTFKDNIEDLQTIKPRGYASFNPN